MPSLTDIVIVNLEPSRVLGPTKPRNPFDSYIFALNRWPTVEELREADEQRKLVLNCWDAKAARAEHLRHDMTLPEVQAAVRKAGLEPNDRHALGIAPPGQTVEEAAYKWMYDIEKATNDSIAEFKGHLEQL